MEVFVSATEGNPGGVLVHVCQGVCSSCDDEYHSCPRITWNYQVSQTVDVCHEAIWTDGTVESGIDKGKKGN